MADIPQHPRACISPHETQSFWDGARLPFRNRRRVTFFLATAFAAIGLFYSHQYLGGKYLHSLSQPQACQSLDPHIPCLPEVQIDSPPLPVTITKTAPPTTETVVVKPLVQPVVFSLLMISEQSAQEGVILLKVLHMAFLFQHCGLV